jgi:hypothetical protein
VIREKIKGETMDKKNLAWIILILAVLAPVFAAAEQAALQDSVIDYTPYREAILNEPGVIYTIRIMNTGVNDRTYSITPDANIVGQIGSYRIDTSSDIKVNSKEADTAYLYLVVEKNFGSRKSIPVTISTGKYSTTIDLVVRQIGPFKEQSKARVFQTQNTRFFTILIFVLLAIILLLAIIALLGRKKKKKDEEEEVQTYY